MNLSSVSEYNRVQRAGFKVIEKACLNLSDPEMKELKEALGSYLQFREALAAYQQRTFGSFCRAACFEGKVSACCGFESIITFFADQVVTYLLSTPEQMEIILHRLEQPNFSSRCVYLAQTGCIWTLTPISCAMFLCDQAKRAVFDEDHHAEAIWEEFRRLEKDYTHPSKPVFFDDIESYFMIRGVDSPLMYYHKSPGLLSVKSRSGQQPPSAGQDRNKIPT